MFSDQQKILYKVGLLGPGVDSVFVKTKHLQMIDYDDNDKALMKLSQHSLDLLVDIEQQKYWVNEDSANGYIVEKLLLAVEPNFTRQIHNGRQIRYVDGVAPGILAMNMMFSCLFGVGYAVVRYRKNSVLKRLQATPLNPIEFIMAQICSRLIIVCFTIGSVYTLCNQLFDFYMVGSYLRLLLVVLLGALSMVSLSLVIAAKSQSEELTNGLLNLVSWPMIIMSGVWFSLEGTPEIMQSMAQLLPLTHMIEGAREIMFNDASLWDVRVNLMALALMTGCFLLIGALTFRWHGEGR
jgi:ABC-type multidrug transport system permease subunit